MVKSFYERETMDIKHIEVTETAYAAIRQSRETGKFWIATDTISYLPEESANIAKKTDKELPGWKDVNPVVKVSKIRITTIAE